MAHFVNQFVSDIHKFGKKNTQTINNDLELVNVIVYLLFPLQTTYTKSIGVKVHAVFVPL